VLADLYAFGATTGYLLVFISLFVLRLNDPFTPRPYMMPLNIQIQYKGRAVWFPLLGVLGFLGVLFFLVMVLLTHQYARIVGPIWVLAAVGLFALYRRKRGLPMFKTLDRDWITATRRVLLEAEEYKSLEEYDAALEEHRAQMGGGKASAAADVPPPPPAIS
jgi:APA family basic amino acid/polyamine antiporter